MLAEAGRLWAHAGWADRLFAEAFEASGGEPALAMREFAHVIGTTETWLARIEHRAPSLAIWPEVAPDEVITVTAAVHARYDELLRRLTDEGLAKTVSYVNSAGLRFDNRVDDILLHAALHGHYHRGKANLLLRQAGRVPVPTDYIAFIRGVPAAITKPR